MMKWIQTANADCCSAAAASLVLPVRRREITQKRPLEENQGKTTVLKSHSTTLLIHRLRGFGQVTGLQNQPEWHSAEVIARINTLEACINGERLLAGNRHHQWSQGLHELCSRCWSLSSEVWRKNVHQRCPYRYQGRWPGPSHCSDWISISWSSQSSLWSTWISGDDSSPISKQRSLLKHSGGRRQTCPLILWMALDYERKRAITNWPASFQPTGGHNWCRHIENCMPI